MGRFEPKVAVVAQDVNLVGVHRLKGLDVAVDYLAGRGDRAPRPMFEPETAVFTEDVGQLLAERNVAVEGGDVGVDLRAGTLADRVQPETTVASEH